MRRGRGETVLWRRELDTVGSGGHTPWGWGIRVLKDACRGLGNKCCGIGVVHHGVMGDPCCGTGCWGINVKGLELGVGDAHRGVIRNSCCGLGWEGSTSWRGLCHGVMGNPGCGFGVSVGCLP